MEKRIAEKRTAEILLERGVKMSITAPLFFRLFFIKTFTFYVKALAFEKHIEVAFLFEKLGIENTGEMGLKEAYSLLQVHGKKVSKIIALSIESKLPLSFRAKLLRKTLTAKEMIHLYNLVVVYGGIEDFINTIRLIEDMRITKPMNLSPEEKTS